MVRVQHGLQRKEPQLRCVGASPSRSVADRRREARARVPAQAPRPVRRRLGAPRAPAGPAAELKADDGDDEPVYVDEESQDVVSKADYEALVAGRAGGDSTAAAASPAAEDVASTGPVEGAESSATQARVVEVGAQKKRKVVKAVGGDDDEARSADEKSPAAPAKAEAKAKRRKKAKMKLSFDDEK